MAFFGVEVILIEVLARLSAEQFLFGREENLRAVFGSTLENGIGLAALDAVLAIFF
jgi:hypothetical protein